ncbi:MAG: protein kinase [Myxococcales bacterium]|nr:protein kinase [Myxococcales bacterium]
MGTHTLAPGTLLGRYELLLPIAQGGMATVWAARQRGSRGFQKTVAIKTILPNLSDDPSFEQMFLDEAAIASRIHHPNVAEILDLGEQDEVLYLVMEWVDGESLSTLSKHARKNGTDIPLRIGLKIITQACAGLHAAHELRDDSDQLLELVHRDVSPQNILVSSSGVVKIVDFGVAKALGRSGETSAGQLKGKVPFMSPEQAKGAALDRRTDVFALGIILYRLATGTHPFLDDNDIKTMRNIIARPPMPPRVKNPKLSNELERIILKALQKDPARRYQTAAELGSEVEFAMMQDGGRVTDEEVATFVRATLGERDRKRSAAIRDAATKMDESGRASLPLVTPPDSVSEMMLTKTATPPTVLADGAVTAAVPAPGGFGVPLPAEPGNATPPTSDAPPRDTRPPAPSFSSSTLAALAAPPATTRPGARSRAGKGLAIGLAIACGVGLGVLAVAKMGKPTAGAPDVAPARAPATTEPATPRPTEDGAPGPSDGKTPVPTSEAKGTDLSVDDLPDKASTTSVPSTGGGRAQRSKATPTATPTTEAKAQPTAAPEVKAPPPPPTSKANVPAVQDPGF